MYYSSIFFSITFLKVSKFQNEFMKSSFLPKYESKIVRISACSVAVYSNVVMLWSFGLCLIKCVTDQSITTLFSSFFTIVVFNNDHYHEFLNITCCDLTIFLKNSSNCCKVCTWVLLSLCKVCTWLIVQQFLYYSSF